jgi:peptidyl-prolyl cis-trans isomerase C
MKKSVQAMAVLGLAFVMSSATPVLAEGDVVAIVNGSKIFKEDVKQALDAMQVKSEEKDKMYPIVLDQVINEKLLDEETAKSKLEESADFKTRMDLARSQILKQIYLEKFLKDKISESKVKSEYDKFKSDNKGKQEIRARHILLASEEEAKKVIKDLNAGAKFEDLAKKRSSGPTAQNGGDLGYFTKEDVVPEFSDAAFKLKVGTYTKEPVKTQFGYHVILVEDKRARKIPELKEVEMAIRNKLGQDALQKLVLDLRAKSDIQRFGLDGKPLPVQGQN